MFQDTRRRLCKRATASAAASETRLPLGYGTTAGLRAVPAISNCQSPPTGLAYSAGGQSRAPAPGNSSKQREPHQ